VYNTKSHMNRENLHYLLRPDSIAVIGASSTPGKIGYNILDNILQGGYQGKVYPINPKDGEILGQKAYPSVEAVPDEIDTAIITVPARLVTGVAEECGRKRVKGLIVITSGFSEVGNHALEDELIDIAKRYGMRVLGPNVVGTLSNDNRLNASFIAPLPLPGKASLVSQSGALLAALNLASYNYRAGFEKLISLGNMADVDFADVVEWLDRDQNTTCIALYMEGIKDGRRFIEAGQKAQKPVIALKAGVTEHGAAAAASHTGSLAGIARLYSAAFQKAGIVQARGLGNLFDRSLALSLQPPMRGDHLVIVTNGGGAGVLSTDAAGCFGIPMQFLPQDLQDELKKYLPEYASTKNPVDLTGMATPDWYLPVVNSTITHPWVDGLVVLFIEGVRHDPLEVAQTIQRAVIGSGVMDKPVAVSFIGGSRSEKANQWLVEHGIPSYNMPEEAVDVISALREYARTCEVLEGPVEALPSGDVQSARRVIQHARLEGRTALTEIEAGQVFAAYHLPVMETGLAMSDEAAARLANKIGYPVAMKIVSPDILHKSDAGGVKVNIQDGAAAREAYETLIRNARAYKPAACLHGVAVQKMAAAGLEVILGSVNDITFGPAVMFGLGGVFVEALKDITFKIAPLSPAQAGQMLDEVRGAALLSGIRGQAPRDREALVDLLCHFSQMVYDLADEISESDANPAIVHQAGQGVSIVDCRILLK
jgi:acetyl coenzyme A synthetase (ADP forming)-like protein